MSVDFPSVTLGVCEQFWRPLVFTGPGQGKHSRITLATPRYFGYSERTHADLLTFQLSEHKHELLFYVLELLSGCENNSASVSMAQGSILRCSQVGHTSRVSAGLPRSRRSRPVPSQGNLLGSIPGAQLTMHLEYHCPP